MQAIGVALAVVLVAAKFKITTLRRILAYHAIVDVIFTIGLAVFMQGTITGLLVSIFAGAILSVVLILARKLLGYEKRILRRCSLGHLHAEWESAPGWLKKGVTA
jgi:hypothetical protein